jgi:hypothetical protein
MKSSHTRRYRRRNAAKEAISFKKDTQQDQQFFGETMHEPFFKPAAVLQPPVNVQRKCAECENEEKEVKRAPDKKEEEKKVMKKEDKKDEDKKLQKTEEKKEEKKLQRKEAGTASTSKYVNSIHGKGNPLPAKAYQFFSSKMGYDFSDVKIHTDKEAAESAKAVNAKAYTVGNHVVFNEGQYNNESTEGKKLMAHELVHVIQQDGNTINRKTDAGQIPEEKKTIPTFSSRDEVFQNTRHFADCNGVSVEGHTDANYGNSYTAPGSSTPGGTCESCTGEDCVTNTGTVISVFTTNPVISLPSVPSGLNECEQQAVRNFINTTLRAHEQQHVAAFNGYRGVVRTPYTYQGCAAGLDAYTQQIHDRIETARKASADANSAALDAGGANIFNITCECPDPAPDAGTK